VFLDKVEDVGHGKRLQRLELDGANGGGREKEWLGDQPDIQFSSELGCFLLDDVLYLDNGIIDCELASVVRNRVFATICFKCATRLSLWWPLLENAAGANDAVYIPVD